MKPEKRKMTEDIIHNRFISGYNQACKDWEGYHNWAINKVKEEKDELIEILENEI